MSAAPATQVGAWTLAFAVTLSACSAATPHPASFDPAERSAVLSFGPACDCSAIQALIPCAQRMTDEHGRVVEYDHHEVRKARAIELNAGVYVLEVVMCESGCVEVDHEPLRFQMKPGGRYRLLTSLTEADLYSPVAGGREYQVMVIDEITKHRVATTTAQDCRYDQVVL